MQLGILLLIPLAMYFLLIRPQRKRAREQQELQKALEVGSEVITTSGMYGTISGEFDDNTFWLEIDDDVQIKIARAAIQSTVSSQAASQTDDSDDDQQTDDDRVDESTDELDDANSAD